MLTRMRIYALMKKAWEINETNSRYRIGVDYSKICGNHQCDIHVIDDDVPYIENGNPERVPICETVDMDAGFGHISFEQALEIMEKYREVKENA